MVRMVWGCPLAPASWSAPVLWRFSGSWWEPGWGVSSASRAFGAKAPEDWRSPKPGGVRECPCPKMNLVSDARLVTEYCLTDY
jgi:hypothetical protein